MASKYPRIPDLLGPPAICMRCGKQCGAMHQAGSHTRPGSRCYHCSEGTFLHRIAWVYKRCTEPHGMYRSGCTTCNGAGVIATRRDIDEIRAITGAGKDWVPWWIADAGDITKIR